MEQEELDRRMDWGLFPRDIICALQALEAYRETDEHKYLLEVEEELKSMLKELEGKIEDAEDKLALTECRMDLQATIRGLEMCDGYQSVEQCSGLQGTLEGLHTRILYETHPALKWLDDIKKLHDEIEYFRK